MSLARCFGGGGGFASLLMKMFHSGLMSPSLMNPTEGERRNEWPGKEIQLLSDWPSREERMTPEPKVLTLHQSPLGARPAGPGLAARLLEQHLRDGCCSIYFTQSMQRRGLVCFGS